MQTLSIAALCMAWTMLAVAQDPLAVDSRHHLLLFENANVRVLLARYEPGEKAPPHVYLPGFALALTDVSERRTRADGYAEEIQLRMGEMWPTRGPYASENTGDQAFEILVVEYKSEEALVSIGFKPASGMSANEASATSILRTINTAEVVFAATYERGFTEGLNRLGEPSSGQSTIDNADLLDPVLAGRVQGGSNVEITRNGYRFTYTPGSTEFGSIDRYSLTARPLQYGVTGTRSFYTDETAVLRATREDRPADVNDPPI